MRFQAATRVARSSGCARDPVGFTHGTAVPLFPIRSMETSTKKRKDAPRAPVSQGQQEEKKGPVKTIRVDDVSASIWRREVQVQGELTEFYSVTFERSYRDSTGQWRYTRYFDLNDLGKVVTAAQQASDYVQALQQKAA